MNGAGNLRTGPPEQGENPMPYGPQPIENLDLAEHLRELRILTHELNQGINDYAHKNHPEKDRLKHLQPGDGGGRRLRDLGNGRGAEGWRLAEFEEYIRPKKAARRSEAIKAVERYKVRK